MTPLTSILISLSILKQIAFIVLLASLSYVVISVSISVNQYLRRKGR